MSKKDGEPSIAYQGDYVEICEGETEALTRESNDEAERRKRDREKPDSQRSCIMTIFDGSQRSCIMTIVDGVNVLAGAGLLSTPFAIKEASWFSLLLLPLFAVLRCYTSILVQDGGENGGENSGQNGGQNVGENVIRSYADHGEDAYGTFGRHLLLIVWQLELYSHCVEVILSEADNLTRLFPGVSFEWAGIHLDSFRYGILTALIVLVIVQFRGVTSYLSAFRVVVTILIVVSLILLGTEHGVGFHLSGSLVNWNKIPFAFQFYSSCYSGHSVFPSISRHLSDSKSFTKALLFSYALATAIYVIFGSLGYLMFGEDTQSQITLNLPKHSISSIFANITMVSVHV
ncbi:amino acid transporter AVT1A-like [Magnolia sinica]|uniref:amino acid transporter AVT1A-like n=1 Tax=Magnolia sinica TaxID=86752 RepID=UPI00265B51DD|nr:amino acid transporter AVT1A-like [Magnolia sinica]